MDDDDDDDGWPFGIGSKQARDLAVFFVAISKPNDSTSLGFALLINCSSIFNAIADLGQTTVFVFPPLLLLLLFFCCTGQRNVACNMLRF